MSSYSKVFFSTLLGCLVLAAFIVPAARGSAAVQAAMGRSSFLFGAADNDLLYTTHEGKVVALHKHDMVTVATDDGNTYRVKGVGWKIGDAVLCDCFTNGRVSCIKVS